MCPMREASTERMCRCAETRPTWRSEIYNLKDSRRHPTVVSGSYVILYKIDNYLEKTPVRIWKKYIPLLIDLLISNNFSMTFFCVTHILRVIGRQSIRQSTNFFTDFLAL